MEGLDPGLRRDDETFVAGALRWMLGDFFEFRTADATGRKCILTHRSQVPNGSKRFNGRPNGHLITGYDVNAFMECVPVRVHDSDRHLIAAALVLVSGLDEEDDPHCTK